jgi:hypothetical protein
MALGQKKRAVGLIATLVEKIKKQGAESVSRVDAKKVKKDLNILLVAHPFPCVVNGVNGARNQNVVKRGKLI